MTTNGPAVLAPERPPAAVAAKQDARIEERVKHLFRLSTRRQSIHPLQHLVLRYRNGERA